LRCTTNKSNQMVGIRKIKEETQISKGVNPEGTVGLGVGGGAKEEEEIFETRF